MRFIRLAVFAALIAFTTLAAAAPAGSFGSAPAFAAGDVVAFVGDSITHGGSYHTIVSLYYATRFPDRPIRFYNRGIGGDRASSIMSDERYRLKVDILGNHPTAATIMLGMNDVGHADYRVSDPEADERRKRSSDIYVEKMAQLIEALRNAGIRVTLITPSIYDETTRVDKANPVISRGVNAALGKFAGFVTDWSAKYDLGLVRFWEVMENINRREQAKDATFTVVGPDRVHPGPAGHFVMAYTLLKAQNLPRDVSRIVIYAGEGVARAVNAEVEGLSASSTRVEFTATERSLPVVVPENARPALSLVPFTADLNQQVLAIHGLAEGRYEVRIDGETAGEFAAADLRTGVNLAEIASTPQYRQSAEATRIAMERQAVGQRLRDAVLHKYSMSRGGTDVSDQAAVREQMRARIEKAKASGKPDPRLERAAETIANFAKFEAEYENLNAALYKACQPKPHRYAVGKKQ